MDFPVGPQKSIIRRLDCNGLSSRSTEVHWRLDCMSCFTRRSELNSVKCCDFTEYRLIYEARYQRHHVLVLRYYLSTNIDPVLEKHRVIGAKKSPLAVRWREKWKTRKSFINPIVILWHGREENDSCVECHWMTNSTTDDHFEQVLCDKG